MKPTDDDFDDMHHALGRPKDPTKLSFRNNYCTQAGGAGFLEFDISSYDRQSHRAAALVALKKQARALLQAGTPPA